MRISQTGWKITLIKTLSTNFFTISSRGGLGLLILMQGKQSARSAATLLASQERTATKQVTCRKKSTRTANAAIIQKHFKAGTSVEAPTKKAKNSPKAAAVILGPTSANPLANFSFAVSPSARLAALDMINILSTPIAKIRNGTTSVEMMDIFIPNIEMMLIEVRMEKMTIRIPENPTKNLECKGFGKLPMATETYKNIRP
mmetsp:Transcript_19401/g.22023  ORF Transcript_19401/g.22023 Transcript_19401/m.22023 type:complete len:201 (-) Transcript_19401:381-983(-)